MVKAPFRVETLPRQHNLLSDLGYWPVMLMQFAGAKWKCWWLWELGPGDRTVTVASGERWEDSGATAGWPRTL